MFRYSLEGIVFCSGAVVMILEIVGARIMAPYLGTSLIVWTGLIGVVLASLSLGYWLGGRLADKGPAYAGLSRIIFWAAISVALCTLLHEVVLHFLRTHFSNIHFQVTLSTAVLFGPPSVLLGMITPYAVRMRLHSLDHSGRTVGRMYALSTIGSIIGTFGAGFVLLAYFGSVNILFVLAAVLGAMSLLAKTEGMLLARMGFILLCLLSVALVAQGQQAILEQGFVDVDTRYSRVWIYETEEEQTGRDLRVMTTSPGRMQSGMYVEEPDELAVEYTRFFRLLEHFHPEPQKVLKLGGGGYSYPKYFMHNFPGAEIDVVELDPMFTELAKEYFALEKSANLAIKHEDARMFLNRAQNRYQGILVDVFKSSYSIPFQLTTLEAVQRMHDLLQEDGLVLMNTISAIEGKKGRYLRAQYATFKAVFPQVYIVPVQDAQDAEKVQNILLLALKSGKEPDFSSAEGELQDMLEHVWTREIKTDLEVFTDNYAPVDRYLLPVLDS